jgi:hypothetical protein
MVGWLIANDWLGNAESSLDPGSVASFGITRTVAAPLRPPPVLFIFRFMSHDCMYCTFDSGRVLTTTVVPGILGM